MSRLDKLFGKPKEFTIGGESMVIHPLTMEHIDLILDLEDQKTRGKAIKEIVKFTVKAAIPDATDEEVSKVGMMHFPAIFAGIKEVNGIGDAEVKSPKA